MIWYIPPVLAMPDFHASFMIETDAYDMAVSIALIQYNQPVALILKVLNFAQCNYYTMDCKLLEILLACIRWHPNLDDKKTVVLIDHKPLIRIHTAPNTPPPQISQVV